MTHQANIKTALKNESVLTSKRHYNCYKTRPWKEPKRKEKKASLELLEDIHKRGI